MLPYFTTREGIRKGHEGQETDSADLQVPFHEYMAPVGDGLLVVKEGSGRQYRVKVFLG